MKKLKQILLSLVTFSPLPMNAAADPMPDELIVETQASFYADHYVGKRTASGQYYTHQRLTCASWDYPFGTVLELGYESASGQFRYVLVEVNDRGPSRELYDKGRKLDLSLAAFRVLENPRVGVIKVTVRVVGVKK